MALAAEQVVQAVAARLAGQTVAGTKVYTSRMWPISDSHLPAVKIFAGDENSRLSEVATRVHEAELEVNVAGLVRSVDELDQDMNALAAEMLEAIFSDEPVPYDLELTKTLRDVRTEGQADVGQITLQLRAKYFYDAAAPETIVST